MNCPSCGTPNEAGRKFCGECGTRLAVACPTCGTPNAPGTRFCGECGSALPADAGAPRAAAGIGPVARPGGGASAAGNGSTGSGGSGAGGSGWSGPAGPSGGAAPVAERRLVTVLFADLVGFTTISEGRDPEEVRDLLSRYFDAARDAIERYAGTVEKFIGDAVMAVWGAPTAHEDDAERAVRAALDVVDAVKTLAPGLQARAGVLTGEAAVTVGARGQGMVAGDLVNTASRLQSAAQPGMVLVGETTQRVTAGSIAYEPAGEQLLKGKASPVPAYHALRVVARRGGAGRGDRLEPPFVGRDSELRLLKDLFHTTSREKRVRLVSVTGQAGVGKSRLAWELRKYADGVAEDLFWHEGRSPAYGQGITFWALGEMVRARAQLLETDDPETTRAKLEESVSRWFPDGDEHARVVRALGALLGVAEAPPGGADELFGAWRRYFEKMAEQYLVIMVFEDLHWADPGTLDFIDHVLEWSRNVPILIVTLARPELLEIRTDWGAGRRNFLALDLEPLPEEPMRELLKGLVPELSEPAIRSIVARAEGIPLYAVETIRMLAADGRLREKEGGGAFDPVGELGDLAVPDSLHALIAARLDALDPADRTLVQDAAVLGQSFTPAGLSAVSGIDQAALVGRLRELVRADLLTEERDDRSPERGQFAFVQALIREVAYSTLSLRDRKSRHLAAARFFESLGDDELAGALAAHYLAAFRATTDPAEAAPLGTQARLALRGAAERAEALGSIRQAIAFYEQALDVVTEDTERADLLERVIQAAWKAGEYAVALELAPELRRLRESMGDRRGVALAIALEAETLYSARQRDKAVVFAKEHLQAFEDMPDDPVVLRLVATLASAAIFTRDYDLARVTVDRGLAAAERLNLPEVAARLLMLKGAVAQFHGRMWEAIALTEGARRVAEQHGLPDLVSRISGGLANIVALDDPKAAVGLQREIIEHARRTGVRESETVTLGNVAEDARRTGEWDWIIAELDRTIQEDLDVNSLLLESARVEFRILRDEVDAAYVEEVNARLEQLEDMDVAGSAHGLRSLVAMLDADFATAAQGWVRMADASDLNAPYALPKAGHLFVMAGDAAGAQAVLDRMTALGARGRAVEADLDGIRAGLAALAGDSKVAQAGLRDVRSRFSELGLAYDVALLGLVAAVRLDPADPEVAGWIGEARQTFERLRATPLVALLDRLVAEAGRAAAKGSGGNGTTSGTAPDAAAGQRASVSST